VIGTKADLLVICHQKCNQNNTLCILYAYNILVYTYVLVSFAFRKQTRGY